MDKTNNMDALMTIALKEIIREDWDAVTSAPDVTPLRPKFNRRMERMISSGGRKKQNQGRLKHIGIGILVALAVFAMLGMAIPPVREAVIRTVFTWYDTHFGVRYETEEPVGRAANGSTSLSTPSIPMKRRTGSTIRTSRSRPFC